MIVDHSNARVLDVLENREKSTVLAYLRHAKQQGLLAQVVEVTTDMWQGYVQAACEGLGEDVRITIDRFHVMKNFQGRLNEARRRLTSPEASIENVAESVGFKGPDSFRRAFMRRFRVTPSKFRRNFALQLRDRRRDLWH